MILEESRTVNEHLTQNTEMLSDITARANERLEEHGRSIDESARSVETSRLRIEESRRLLESLGELRERLSGLTCKSLALGELASSEIAEHQAETGKNRG